MDGWWWVGGTERQEKGQAAAGGERMGKEPGNGKGWQWQAFPHQAVGAPAVEVYGIREGMWRVLSLTFKFCTLQDLKSALVLVGS